MGVGVGETFCNSPESRLIGDGRRCGFLATAGRPTFVAAIHQHQCELGYMDRGGYYRQVTAPTTATELTVIFLCAQKGQMNPNSKLPAKTEHQFSLGMKTACSRDLHFQRPFRIDRRHTTAIQLVRRRVLANHVKISWTWGNFKWRRRQINICANINY